MLLNIAIILFIALILNYFFQRVNLPGILGMILTGIVLGPGCSNIIDSEVLLVLKEFKTAALIVILVRAGLGINRQTLKKVGKPALKMSFIPGVFEGLTILFIAHYIFHISFIESGMLGFIIAAVSPAVVVPQMLDLKESGYGKNKEVPTLILAGASLDDVFAITIFGVFTGLASGSAIQVGKLLFSVPLGIVLGALLGIVLGGSLVWFFKRFHIRDTKKVILFMIIAVAFYELTELKQIKDFIPLAGLLGIMAMGFIIFEKYNILANRLAIKFNKIWVLAEILLFCYIGTEVRIDKIDSNLVLSGLLLLAFGLIARSIGVWFSLHRSGLNHREKVFCMISYLPKATVQAAIGAVPLSMFYEGKMATMTEDTGQLILTLAVLSIIITAPLGAIGIKISGPRLLERDTLK